MNLKTTLLQLETRLKELESLAEEMIRLLDIRESGDAQTELGSKGQRWYRGGRELLLQQKSSCLDEFDLNYTHIIKDVITGSVLAKGHSFDSEFISSVNIGRSLLGAVVEEIKSRELPIKSQLSFAVSADEFEKASELLQSSSGDEAIVRAAGVIGRVALERHLWTLVEVRGIIVQKNPSTKKKADTQDLLTSLVKENVITPIQKTEFDSLFSIGNNCAHPKEAVVQTDVQRLISRGRELAATIL